MSEAEVLVRLGVALVFGALIGVERQWHHKNAGVKTHSLVALGSATIAIVSTLGLGPNSAPTQLAVGVVTGIGFIGGGVIIVRAGGVQGITTAATLWATSALGLVLGGGYYTVAAMVFLGILFIQFPLRALDAWIDSQSAPSTLLLLCRLAVQCSSAVEDNVRSLSSAFVDQLGTAHVDWSEARSGTEVSLEMRVAMPLAQVAGLRALAQRLAGVDGVSKVEWSASNPVEGD
jgi:putative Mg2+ transporter-C (MgtC) family protein